MVRKQFSATDENVIRHDLRVTLDKVPPVDWVFRLAGGYAGASDAALERADLRIANNLIGRGLAAEIKSWICAIAAEVYDKFHVVDDEEAYTQSVIPYGRVKLIVERLLMEHFKDL